MTVRELISLLEEAPEDLEVRIVHQPTYPIEMALRGINFGVAVEDCDDEGEPISEALNYLTLVAGDDIGYGHKESFEGVLRS